MPSIHDIQRDSERYFQKWKGSGPKPDKFTAPDGVIVYTSYEAYCMD